MGQRHTIMQLIICSLLGVLFVGYGAVLLYYTIGWRRIPPFSAASGKLLQPSLAITVIVPARNEAAHIKACLDSICRQTYPDNLIEIIVVDDHSTDATASLVKQYANRVKLISLQQYTGGQPLNSYKKKAIETAIAQATGKLMVCTDADCLVPEKWLETIAAFQVQRNADFIAMPVSFIHPRLPIEIFQSLDFMTLQGITGAAIQQQVHSMCNGANLAYTKTAFESVGGFKGIDAIASGDDMLLMHKIYRQNPTGVHFLKSADVIVQTQPVKTIGAFLNQRIRWASKADKYDDKRIIAVLLLVYLFNVLMLLTPLVAAFGGDWQIGGYSLLQCWAALLLAKTIAELIFLVPVAGFFKQQKLLFYFPFAQPFHILYTVIAGWLGKFGSYRWKGRAVR